jgi:hypothetical protein
MISGCYPGYKVAREYVKHHSDTILIIPSYELFKDNLTIRYDTNTIYSPEQFDSIAWVQSLFIQHISDSVFLTNYTNSLIKALNKTGYTVFVIDSSQVQDSLAGSKWEITIAQLQLNEERIVEEIGIPQLDYNATDNVTKQVNGNRVSLACWFKANATGYDSSQLLYYEGWGEDSFKAETSSQGSEFAWATVIRDSIGMEEVYLIAHLMGEKHAELLFNYFLNEYLKDKSPPGKLNEGYYNYWRKNKSLLYGDLDQFDHFEILTPGD